MRLCKTLSSPKTSEGERGALGITCEHKPNILAPRAPARASRNPRPSVVRSAHRLSLFERPSMSGRPYPDFVAEKSAPKRFTTRLDATEEDTQPGIPGQYSVDDASSCPDDLTGQEDEVVHESFELHAYESKLLRSPLLFPSPVLR